MRRREIALKVLVPSRRKYLQREKVSSTGTSSVVDGTTPAVGDNALMANMRYQTRAVKRRLQQEEEVHKEDERIPAPLNLGYKNLHSLITAAAAVASASRETPLSSVLSLARAVRQKVAKDTTLQQQQVAHSNSAAQHKRQKTSKNSMTARQAASKGVRATAHNDDTASQTTPTNSTVVRVSLFRAVKRRKSTTVDQEVSEDHSLVATQQARHVVTHVLNDVMNKLTMDDERTSSVQPCSQTHQSAQPSRDIPPPARKPPSNSKKSNSRLTSTPNDHPVFTSNDRPALDDQPAPDDSTFDDQAASDDQRAPDDRPASTAHQQSVSTTPTIIPVTSKAPTTTQANVQYSAAPLWLAC